MTNPYELEIVANLARSEESIQAAKILLAAGHFDFVASRAYYATFYASTAALLNEGLQFGSHRGTLAAIHTTFVKTGRLDKPFGQNLNWLFELRNIGDYGETRHVPSDEAQKAIEAAESFLAKIKEMLGRS